jgi:hypothetical protein
LGDKKRVLVFSDAGGSRMHYLVQPGWRLLKGGSAHPWLHRLDAR